MEPYKDPYSIGVDKEIALQMLKLNNIQVIELTELDQASFPLIGRKFGHHGGKDITIVHSKDQGLESGFDYFTKLYCFEKEYRFEVHGLNVVRVQEAVPKTLNSTEIQIRTESMGWRWGDSNIEEIQDDYLQMAIRAVYTIGFSNAYVKMGKLPNESLIVIGVTPMTADLEQNTRLPNPTFTIGADIEFMLKCDDDLLPASEFFPFDGPIGCDGRQIEQDSGDYALAEIRPDPSKSPLELYNNIKKLLVEASNKIPYENISFHAGSMPFFGYQCGGHIHFGVPLSVSLLRALDYYIAIPLAMIEESSPSRRRRKTKHGGLGRFREKPYGFEYLSLSSWMIDPEITLATLCLAKLVVLHHHELPCEYLYNPLVQRAYYHGNRQMLKFLWNDIKKYIMSTKSYPMFEKDLSVLFDYIENGHSLNGYLDLRQSWGMSVPKQSYERGLIIQIPRKTRTKFNLIEGQKMIVCAGKSLTHAIIRPYPFSFRNSNIIQLSPSLRKDLSLPKDWIPKIASANGALILGPILGILASRPFERQATYFQYLSRIAKEKQMFVYVFEPTDIQWEKQLIKGTTINGEGFFPFPAVIYDRYFWNNNNQKTILDEVRAKLQIIYDIPFINPPSLFELTGNKWASHQLLSEEYHQYLPDSRLLKDPNDISEMLNRYGEIFIKPVGGALGNGIVRVLQTTSGIYWMNSNNRALKPLNGLEELNTTFFPLQDDVYLVQEAIKRKKLNGNYVEIRAYMQKNGLLKWMRTGMVARLTNEGLMSEETEINKRSSEVLNRLFSDPGEIREIKKQIAEVTRGIVELVEKDVGAFGELAIDFCIDQYNTVKLLEINAKPDNLFSQVKAYRLRHLAALRLLNYATSLAGYEIQEKE